MLKRTKEKIKMTEKTIKEWEKEYDFRILDPDGFDRSDPNLYSKQFTREEFEKKAVSCTIEGKVNAKGKRSIF